MLVRAVFGPRMMALDTPYATLTVLVHPPSSLNIGMQSCMVAYQSHAWQVPPSRLSRMHAAHLELALCYETFHDS